MNLTSGAPFWIVDDGVLATSPIVLAMVVALGFGLYRLVAGAVKPASLSPESGARVRRNTGIALGGWLLLAWPWLTPVPQWTQRATEWYRYRSRSSR